MRAGATLADYNMEAQGELLADYFALKFMHDLRVLRQRGHAAHLPLYEQVLAGFLADPADPANLPRGPARTLARGRSANGM